MPAPLQRHRVHFAAWADDDHDTGRFSNAIDLREFDLKAILFPPGGVGRLRALVRTEARDGQTNAPVEYVEAVGFGYDLEIGDDAEAGSWIVLDRSWPLMDTVFVLDTAREEPFDLILVTANRV